MTDPRCTPRLADMPWVETDGDQLAGIAYEIVKRAALDVQQSKKAKACDRYRKHFFKNSAVKGNAKEGDPGLLGMQHPYGAEEWFTRTMEAEWWGSYGWCMDRLGIGEGRRWFAERVIEEGETL